VIVAIPAWADCALAFAGEEPERVRGVIVLARADDPPDDTTSLEAAVAAHFR
jgi:hypothetical protein